MICPYCGNQSELVTGRVIHPHRFDLFRRKFYLCRPCKAYVGCHGETTVPLGRMANAKLRKAKIEAHTAFDQLWKSGEMTRTEAYSWLSDTLGMDKRHCHIAMFDVPDCQRVISAVASRNA